MGISATAGRILQGPSEALISSCSNLSRIRTAVRNPGHYELLFEGGSERSDFLVKVCLTFWDASRAVITFFCQFCVIFAARLNPGSSAVPPELFAQRPTPKSRSQLFSEIFR